MEEKVGPPPSYESSVDPTSATLPPPVSLPVDSFQERSLPSSASTAIPIFLTARTSVYGVNPVEMDCPHCQAHIVTHIERTAGTLTWVIVIVCFILGFFLAFIPWCLCCIPFCADSCLDILHSCPCCKRHLGRYKRM